MSTTDQAFIKAYERDHGHQMPPPPHIPVAGMQATTEVSQRPPEVEEIYAPDPALQRAADPYIQHPADIPSAANARIDESAADRVPKPHTSFWSAVGVSQGEENSAALTSTETAAEGGDETQATSPSTLEVGADGMFRPALAVDSFLWPTVTRSLARHTGDAFTEVAMRLTDAARTGQRVVAIAGCQRGEGRTTTLLGIARQLSKMNAKVALVDADFHQPQLAERLGLAVECGWEAVLRGKLPLAEVVVQAERDRVALLPLRPLVGQAEELARSIQVSIGMGVLRRNFELVLVDLGPLLEPLVALSALPLAIEARIDSAILVHDVRSVSADDLAAASRRLSQVGVTTIGIAENFLALDDLPTDFTTESTAVAV